MFPLFPEFSMLDIAQKEAYDKRIIPYPPLSDLSFTTLMMWWNLDNSLGISVLNGNLIFSYNAPDDETNSGMSIAGVTRIDDTIQTIFEELGKQGREKKLVHVPDFVVEKMVKRGKFNVQEERDYDEYIFPVRSLYPAENIPTHTTRRKVSKFICEAGGEEAINFVSLDLTKQENRDLLLESYAKWPIRSEHGSDRDWEFEVIKRALINASAWGVYGKCLFIKGEICGFVVYQITASGDSMILNHMRVNYNVPYVSVYLVHRCAQDAASAGIGNINMEMDLGVPGLRFFKSHLVPFDLLRKYTITPKNT